MVQRASWKRLERDAVGFGPQVAEAVGQFRSTYLVLPRLLPIAEADWTGEDRELLRYAIGRVRDQLEALDRLLGTHRPPPSR